MYTKLIFAMLMAVAMIGNAEASETEKENIEICSTIVNKKKIPVYKAKGYDPLIYSGRFPFRRIT